MSKGIIDEIFQQNREPQKRDFEGLIASVKTKTTREIEKYTGLVQQYQNEIAGHYKAVQNNTNELQQVEQRIFAFEAYVRKKANLAANKPIPKIRKWTGNFGEFDAKDTRELYSREAYLKRSIQQSNSSIANKQGVVQIYQRELEKWSR
jgi:DNA/RNA-binding domain of Phe-tRNA-synthetase-like protein